MSRTLLTLPLFVAGLAGCAVGPDFHGAPASITPNVTLDAASRDAAGAVTDALPSHWWTLFQDPLLDALQTELIHASPDLKTATSRIEQARARYGIAHSTELPTLGVGASYGRNALSENSALVAIGAPSDPYNQWNAGFDASWEIDLWGANKRRSEEASAELDATTLQREALQVSLSAELTRDYITLRGTQARLALARQNRELAHQSVELSLSRFNNGVATRYDVAAAEAQVDRIDAQLPLLAQAEREQRNALALLLGLPPGGLDARLDAESGLPELPQQVPVGVSSELARRRPDILVAEARLHVATAAIGAAKADFYPRIELTGKLGLDSLESDDFGNWSSRTFSVGPSIYLPIFQGGRLQRSLELSQAKQQEAAIEYQQTVLGAWHEVSNALAASAAERQRDHALEQAVQHSQEAFDMARKRYASGAGDVLTELTAQRELLEADAARVQGKTASALALVTLYKALGGGWPGDQRLTASAPSHGDTAAGAAR